jgi:hypothetical protein
MSRRSRQPGFGIVSAPATRAPAPRAAGAVPVPATGHGDAPVTLPAPQQDDEATAYGFVPRTRIRADRSDHDPAFEVMTQAARAGDWRTVAATLPMPGSDPDRHYRAVSGMAELAAQDDSWLNAWLDAAPGDPNAWCVHADAMVLLAWELRSSAWAEDLLPEQVAGFLRVLRQVPAACARATSLAPGLATPWITLMACAQGLGWENGRFHEVWAGVVGRAPQSVAAHRRALQYWLPRWHGSAELAAGFVAEMTRHAVPGSLLSGVRLEHLFLERVPSQGEQRSAYFRGAELAGALDAALADLRAAPLDHPYRAHHRHWLAYFLGKAGRYAEAVEEFRAVDGYAGAWPWSLFADPAGTFANARAHVIRGWQARA